MGKKSTHTRERGIIFDFRREHKSEPPPPQRAIWHRPSECQLHKASDPQVPFWKFILWIQPRMGKKVFTAAVYNSENGKPPSVNKLGATLKVTVLLEMDHNAVAKIKWQQISVS